MGCGVMFRQLKIQDSEEGIGPMESHSAQRAMELIQADDWRCWRDVAEPMGKPQRIQLPDHL